jgi:micrococcal nuclease
MYHYKAKLVRVIDGDTIDVDIDLGFDVWLKRQRIRLAGIDAPESRTRNKAEKVLGLAAKARLTELCSE